MAGFVNQLPEINALADGSPGFIWRLQSEAGDNTYLRPYDDPLIIFNLSVWESVDALKQYVYRSQHAAAVRNRKLWFEKMDTDHLLCGGFQRDTLHRLKKPSRDYSIVRNMETPR